jgi:hypothetical protein
MQSLRAMEFVFFSFGFASCFPSTFDKKELEINFYILNKTEKMRLLLILTPPIKTAVCRRNQTSSVTKTWTSDWRFKPFSTVNSSCQFATNLSTVKTKLNAVAELWQFCNRKFMHVTFRGSSNFQGNLAGCVRDRKADRLYLKWKGNVKTSKTLDAYAGNLNAQNFSTL